MRFGGPDNRCLGERRYLRSPSFSISTRVPRCRARAPLCREAMTKALWTVDVEQQAILVIMASALAWFALRRGLAPPIKNWSGAQ